MKIKLENQWFAMAIPCGILCGFLTGIWSLLIGNDFWSNSIGAFMGIIIAYIIFGVSTRNYLKG